MSNGINTNNRLTNLIPTKKGTSCTLLEMTAKEREYSKIKPVEFDGFRGSILVRLKNMEEVRYFNVVGFRKEISQMKSLANNATIKKLK